MLYSTATHLFVLPIGLLSLFLTTPAHAIIIGEYFCQNIYRLNTEGYWTESEGSFLITISGLIDDPIFGASDGAISSYRYQSTSEKFGDLTLEGGEVSNTGFSWVYTFRGLDNTLYDIEDLWDGDTYLKVYDPFGTNILDATCVGLEEAQ